MIASASASPAFAETGEFMLHVDISAGFSLSGEYTEDVQDSPELSTAVFASLEWASQSRLGFELGAALGSLQPGESAPSELFVGASAGPRLRLHSDARGYFDEPLGNLMGALMLSSHVGVYRLDGVQIGVDIALSYELSVARPMQLGVQLRTLLLFQGESDDLQTILFAGVSASFDMSERSSMPTSEVTEPFRDRDGDGLGDERERDLGTNPRNSDSDGDGWSDGAEIQLGSDPLDERVVPEISEADDIASHGADSNGVVSE